MKHQKVSVDVWAMAQSMAGYVAVVILAGVFLRLVVAVVSLPSRFRAQRRNVQEAMQKLQEKFPEAFEPSATEAAGVLKETDEDKKGEEEKEKKKSI